MRNLILLSIFLIGMISSAICQDPSALVDYESTTQGVLIPRMTHNQRTLIASPATGLLVYQIDSATGFWFYDGFDWNNLSIPGQLADKDNDTKIHVEKSADEDMIRFDVGGMEGMLIDSAGKVGIGIDTPQAKLHLKGGCLLIEGEIGELPISGPGRRLMWIAERGAFRAGSVSGDDWDDGLIGNTSFVAGGQNNRASGSRSFAGAGFGNKATNTYSVTLGGLFNLSSGYSSFASGVADTASGYGSFVGGGSANLATGDRSFIGGGYNNHSFNTYSFIGGGYSNLASGYGSFVAGGMNDSAKAYLSFVGGGENNQATDNQAFVGGGQHNKATDNNSFVGGGKSNTASGGSSFIGGGESNIASGIQSFAGGGQNNTSSGGDSFIGGGTNNTASGFKSQVVGGQSNSASSFSSSVSGGQNNTASGSSSFVGGGFVGTASGVYAFVGGGQHNTSSGQLSFTGGGQLNLAAGSSSFIGGGQYNTAYIGGSFIGGGANDTAFGANSFIGAGKQLIARSYAEAVFGTYNTDYSPISGTTIQPDDRLFVIGNGTASSDRSNALTVLKDGRVGLGTDIPLLQMHISQDTSNLSSALPGFTTGMIISGSSLEPRLYFEHVNAPTDKKVMLMDLRNGRMNWSSTNDNGTAFIKQNILVLEAEGDIGIGISNPTHPLHLGVAAANGAHCTAAGVWTNGSDMRLKKKIAPMDYGLTEIMALQPVKYHMRSNGEKQIGLIAQEVRDILPELVSGTEGDLDKGETLGLSYGNLTAVLVKAIQEQQDIIERQQEQMEEWKAEMSEIRKLLTGLTVQSN